MCRQLNISYCCIVGVVVVEEGRGAVTVELPDGTQAIVHNAITEEPQGAVFGCFALLSVLVFSV